MTILSWNAVDKLERAVRSALDQTWTDVEVLVVDNASTDGSLDLFPKFEEMGCRTIRNDRNLGFAAGMNVAYDATDADVFIALNCDAVLDAEFVASAIELLSARPDVGVVGALVYRTEGPVPTPSGESPATSTIDGFKIGLRRSMRTCLVETDAAVDMSFKPNGSCPVLRRKCVESVRAAYGTGPFDAVFDTYGEDIDLAFKAWALGWVTIVSSAVIAAHERSYGKQRRAFDRRGRLLVNSIAARHLNAWRHLPAGMLASSLAVVVAGDLALVARQLAFGQVSVIGDLCRGWFRVWRLRHSLRQFRRDHPPLPRAAVMRAMAGAGATATGDPAGGTPPSPRLRS